MTQPKTTLSDLRKLCDSATSGKWYALTNLLNLSGVFVLDQQVCFSVFKRDADFIAGADPTMVTLLLDEITKLREALKNSIETIHDEFCSGNPHHSACSEPNKTLTQSKERLPE